MFSSLPIVFNTLGVAGNVISFFFFGMITIAAITSVISLLEVVTQFFIQKYNLNRKKAIAIVGSITFLLSIPIGISLGYAITGKEGMTIAGRNWLEFFDLISNTVLMPICALGSCIALGWFAFKGKSVKDYFSVNRLYKKLDEDGLKLGGFGRVFAFMVKYVTPILIAVIEIFGIIDLVFPFENEKRVFSANGLAIVLTAYAILFVVIAVYFIFFKNKTTGTNDDEFKTIDVKSE